MQLSYTYIESSVGRLKLVASEAGLVAILWENDRPGRVRLEELVEDPKQKHLVQAERELREYFAGERQSFSVPLDMQGTTFQKRVWAQLLTIPYGETRSYGQIAIELGNPHADAGGWSRQWAQPGVHHRSVSSRCRLVGRSYRFCWRA